MYNGVYCLGSTLSPQQADNNVMNMYQYAEFTDTYRHMYNLHKAWDCG